MLISNWITLQYLHVDKIMNSWQSIQSRRKKLRIVHVLRFCNHDGVICHFIGLCVFYFLDYNYKCMCMLNHPISILDSKILKVFTLRHFYSGSRSTTDHLKKLYNEKILSRRSSLDCESVFLTGNLPRTISTGTGKSLLEQLTSFITYHHINSS